MNADNNKFKRLLEIDRRHIWHPYTQMKDFEAIDPLFVNRAEGVFLYDMEERAYYDTISSWWCILHGHNHPHIRESIVSQLSRLDQVHFAGTTHEPAIRVAEILMDMLPPQIRRVFFSDNGSTAIEVALKMAVQYRHIMGERERTTIVSLEMGYHGDTIGAMSLGGVPQFKGPFDALTFDSIRLKAPYCYRCPFNKGGELMRKSQDTDTPDAPDNCGLECLDDFEALLTKDGDRICALVIEPLLMGAGGMLVYPEAYLRRISELSRQYGIFLIFDEIATGFGRTGELFAFMKVDIVPDFLCISKGLTGGTLALAATITSDEIYMAFYDDYIKGKTFFHGHTFTANPIACTAAKASLELIGDRNEDIIASVKKKELLIQALSSKFYQFPFVGDIRGIGMIIAFELVMDRDLKTPFPQGLRAGWRMYLTGLKHGLILRPLADVTYLFLPPAITLRQIEDCFERLWDTFKEWERDIWPRLYNSIVDPKNWTE